MDSGTHFQSSKCPDAHIVDRFRFDPREGCIVVMPGTCILNIGMLHLVMVFQRNMNRAGLVMNKGLELRFV